MITFKKVDYGKENNKRIKNCLCVDIINSVADTVLLCYIKFADTFMSTTTTYIVPPSVKWLAIIVLIGANLSNVVITFRKMKLINAFDLIIHIFIAILPLIIYQIF